MWPDIHRIIMWFNCAEKQALLWYQNYLLIRPTMSSISHNLLVTPADIAGVILKA